MKEVRFGERSEAQRSLIWWHWPAGCSFVACWQEGTAWKGWKSIALACSSGPTRVWWRLCREGAVCTVRYLVRHLRMTLTALVKMIAWGEWHPELEQGNRGTGDFINTVVEEPCTYEVRARYVGTWETVDCSCSRNRSRSRRP